VESIKKYFFNKTYKDVAKALTNAITFANYTLFEQAQKDVKYKGMGCTLAMVIVSDNKIYYAYAGDSRIYVLKNKQLEPLTRDHVKDQENLKDAEVQVLIGRNKDLKFSVCRLPLIANENETYLVCTDGLTDQVSNDEITVILADSDKSPEHKCQELIEKAKAKGGDDCVSVQVFEFDKAVEPLKPSKNYKNLKYILIAVFALALLTFAGNKAIEYFVNKDVKIVKVENTEKKKKQPKITIDKKEQVTKKEEVKETDEVQHQNQQTLEPKTVEEKPKSQSNTTIALNQPIYYMHKVKYGDNLYRLGLRYNISQKQLIDINGKKATNLIAGTALKIPVKAIHKVLVGESYSIISDKYNVKIKLICLASDINESIPLKEGMELVIPLTK